MATFFVILGVFWGVCILSAALLRWNEVCYRRKGLPPGTMGWPFFGETAEFLKQGLDSSLIPLSGYVVPQGWRIYVYTREINYDPRHHPDPFTFNPWRWLEKRGLEGQHKFLIFGAGTRQCPGKELGLAEISTFLHYLVTRYDWEEVGKNKLVKFPRVEAPDGLHIRVHQLHNHKN